MSAATMDLLLDLSAMLRAAGLDKLAARLEAGEDIGEELEGLTR